MCHYKISCTNTIELHQGHNAESSHPRITSTNPLPLKLNACFNLLSCSNNNSRSMIYQSFKSFLAFVWFPYFVFCSSSVPITNIQFCTISPFLPFLHFLPISQTCWKQSNVSMFLKSTIVSCTGILLLLACFQKLTMSFCHTFFHYLFSYVRATVSMFCVGAACEGLDLLFRGGTWLTDIFV